MKFNKLYILPLCAAALGLGACSNEDESIFDQSAAERLEAGQKEYFSTLCADGGLWAMEYFANTEEPGYLFVMQFNADKSVNIHTDHKWIGSTYKSEISLWDVINDNSNVLTFNSYNTLFHIFSNPENITGTDAPKDTNGDDVDEQGYGHNGDYEFMLMENTDGNIRLLGKKRGLYAYLRHLPSDTDIEQYLADAAAKRAVFSNKNFPTYVMTETATGATYDVTGLSSGVVSVMPYQTSSEYSRTETKACIITSAGMRPYIAFDFIRENDSRFTVDEFTWADDGSLVAPGVRITAPVPATNLLRRDLKTWNIVSGSMSDALASAMDEANAETVNIGKEGGDILAVFGRNPQLKNLGFGYETVGSNIRFALKGNCGNQPIYYYGEITALDNGKYIKFTFTDVDDPLRLTVLPAAPKVKTFLDMFAGEYTAVNDSPMDATLMHLTSVSNPEVSFSLKLK